MVDIEKLYNGVVEELAKKDVELQEYKKKILPKFNLGDKIFAVDITNHQVVEFKFDQIIISKVGVSYIEFISETEWRQFFETYCFETRKEAEKALAVIKEQNNNVVITETP